MAYNFGLCTLKSEGDKPMPVRYVVVTQDEAGNISEAKVLPAEASSAITILLGGLADGSSKVLIPAVVQLLTNAADWPGDITLNSLTAMQVFAGAVSSRLGSDVWTGIFADIADYMKESEGLPFIANLMNR